MGTSGDTSPGQGFPDEPEPTAPNEQPTENPMARSFAFQLTVPPIEVKMVNAIALNDYEVWLFVASLAFSAAVGFVVAYLQSIHTASGHSQSNHSFLVMSILCAILFLVFFVRALLVRRGLARNARTYEMTASARVE